METKIADNYIFDSVLDHSVGDSDKTPFTRKNLSYILDQQGGNSSYTSGQVIIDSTSLASSGSTFQDWSNAYVTIPYNVKLEGTTATATTVTAATKDKMNFLTSFKNNALIDSITVEQGGRTIINQTANLSQFVNFRMHVTSSQDQVAKMGSSLGYSPDSVGNYSFTNTAGLGVVNVANSPASTSFSPENYNAGVLARQCKGNPYTSSATTTNNQKTECEPVQVANGTVNAGTTTFSDIHLVATIRLKDLADYFDKHPKLSRGIGYKIYLRINQGVTTFAHADTSGASPFNTIAITGQTFVGTGSSLCQPAMVHVGANTLGSLLTLTAASVISQNTLKLTSQIDVGSNALMNGIRLYVPSYEASPESQALLMKQPTLHRPFFDLYATTLQNQGSNAFINTQVASGISSPKAIIVCPQIAQASTVGMNSQASALNPCPGVTDPQLSLTNIQVKVGSQYVLPDRVNYEFVQFLENNAQLFGLNGNQTNMLSSGVIDMFKFRHNYRYYAYDLSRYLDSADKIPQMITFESFNNSAVPVDLYIYVLYERDAMFSLQEGSVEVE